MNLNYYAFGISASDAKLFKESIPHGYGFIGIHQHPQGYVVICDSEINAQRLRNIMQAASCSVGKEVYPFPCQTP